MLDILYSDFKAFSISFINMVIANVIVMNTNFSEHHENGTKISTLKWGIKPNI